MQYPVPFFRLKSITLLSIFAVFQPVIAQETWTKYPVPVLTRSAVYPEWTGLATADAFVMKDNDTLKMWFSGSGWLSGADTCVHVRMGYAWSMDGITWNEYAGNPVLDISTDTSDFDADGIETPWVIKDLDAPANERYKLWYAGRKTLCSPVLDHQFGYATSPDGIHWTKYSGNPVFSAGTASDWYNTFVSNPCVIKEGSNYKMWFGAPDAYINGQPTDGKGNIGYATSTDGIAWNVHPSPVLIAGDQFNWDSASVAEPNVIKLGGTYHMFYSALDQWSTENFQVGYATSADGINWVKSMQNPVLQIGGNGDWDRYWASHPGVIYDDADNTFKMWYTGRDTSTIVSLSGYNWDIGYAESSFVNGIDEIGNSDYVNLYPNPATNVLHVQTSFSSPGTSVQIYNQMGQIQKEFSFANEQTMVLNLTYLPNGVYYLIVSSDEAYVTKKIVLNR